MAITSPPKMFGAYVTNISASMGYGADGSNLQLTLVEDLPNGVAVNFPQLGTACQFIFEGFSFGGVLQSHTKSESLSGFTYEVTLEAPAKVLDGVQVILDAFEGTAFSGNYPFEPALNEANFTNQISNVFNPFAVRENYTFGGSFGGANVNSAGFPVRDALNLIEEISQGDHPFGGPIQFGESEYEISFEGLASKMPQYYRLKGPVQSLNSLIQDCCDTIIHDYTVTVEVDPSAANGVISGTAKMVVKTIDKSTAPQPGAVASLVDDYKRSGLVVSSNIGKELSDNPTQKLVIGGRASRYWEASSALHFPITAKTRDSRYILKPSQGIDAFDPVTCVLEDGSTYEGTVLELRCALSGRSTWDAYHCIKALKENSPTDTFSKIQLNRRTLNKMKQGTANPMDLLDTSGATANKLKQMYLNKNVTEKIDKVFAGVQKSANIFCTEFMVVLPSEPGGIANNLRFVEEDMQFQTSWENASSAWIHPKPVRDIAFYDGDARLLPAAAFSYRDNYDYSSFGSDYANYVGPDGLSYLSAKATVGKEIYWLDNAGYPTAMTPVTFPRVQNFDEYTTQQNGVTVLVNAFFNINIQPNGYGYFGFENAKIPMAANFVKPRYLGIPQESSRYTWGPWYLFNAKNGRAEVSIEDSLRPETFGNFNNLNNAGFAYAYTGLANIYASENGTVKLAEEPRWNIAERFGGAGPYVTNISIAVGTDGINTTYKFNTWTNKFGKLAKYNIDRISRVNKNTIKFLQEQRNKSPRMPIKPIKLPEPPQDKVKDLFKQPAFAMFMANFLEQNPDLGSASNSATAKLTPNMSGSVPQNAMQTLGQDYTGSAGSSVEQLLTPVSIDREKTDESQTPGVRPPGLYSSESSGFFSDDHVGPTCVDLDPYFAFGDPKETTDFQTYVHNQGSQDINPNKPENGGPRIDQVRVTSALRGPILLSGWGYGLNDQPVPSLGQGIRDDDDNFKFEPETPAVNRATWKTGPVDLRWDDERQVWAGGLHFVEGILKTAISAPSTPATPTSATGSLRRLVSSADGDYVWKDLDEEITLVNRDPSLTVDPSAADYDIYFMACRINYEWRVVYVSCDNTQGAATSTAVTSPTEETGGGGEDTESEGGSTSSDGGGTSGSAEPNDNIAGAASSGSSAASGGGAASSGGDSGGGDSGGGDSGGGGGGYGGY